MKTLCDLLNADNSHGLSHRCVAREKGGFERGYERATPGDSGERSAEAVNRVADVNVGTRFGIIRT